VDPAKANRGDWERSQINIVGGIEGEVIRERVLPPMIADTSGGLDLDERNGSYGSPGEALGGQ
jgi:hypothetical protein